MSVQDSCICCNEPVRARQQGLQCNGCEKWQHHTCDSGILQTVYQMAVKCKQDVDWRCQECVNISAGILLHVAESMRVTHQGKCMYFTLYTQNFSC